MTSAGIIPSSWQLAQQINKKLHKPFTVQHTSIIRLQKTIGISVIILIIDMVPLNKNLVFKYLVNVKVGLNILVLISLNIWIFKKLKKKRIQSNILAYQYLKKLFNEISQEFHFKHCWGVKRLSSLHSLLKFSLYHPFPFLN